MLKGRWWGLGITLAGLLAAFHGVLAELVRFCWGQDLYSYVPLIPVVSGYVVWVRRRGLNDGLRPWPWLAGAPALIGTAILAACARGTAAGWRPPESDFLAAMVAALLFFVVAVCCLFLSPAALRKIVFPLGFLVFAIPMPAVFRDGLEHLLQEWSAIVANGLFSATFTTYWRQDLVFHLMGITIQVAPECSGIRSTLVLFILSLLAAHLYLQGFWRRAAFIAFVLPLAILRNGFRIWVIGELCIHVGPQMIDSYIHTKGGPIFFALSLVPFYWLLHRLRRGENLPAYPQILPKTT